MPWPEVQQRAQSAIAAQVPGLQQSIVAKLPAWDRDRIVSLAQGFSQPLATPIFLRSFDDRLIGSILYGALMFRIYLYIDWEKFAALVQETGAEFAWGTEKAARRARSMLPAVRPPIIGGRLAQIRAEDVTIQISDPNLVQMLFDGVTPKAIIENLVQAARLLKEGSSSLPDPIG